MAWTEEAIPSQAGRVAVVTGANTGIGFEAARALAEHGAHVILACRNQDKGRHALARILGGAGDVSVELATLDLSRLASVRAFAERLLGLHRRLDLLVNNAGVMAIPRAISEDGFELQLATNHLGPFALTGLLLPALVRSEAARVVTVASQAHRAGRIDFDDLHHERSYNRWLAYCQTKLANLLFTYELQRRLETRHSNVISLACHPGYVSTQLQEVAADAGSRIFGWGMDAASKVLSQGPKAGALPTLYAATAPEAAGGGYYGPSGLIEFTGTPGPVSSSRRSHDTAAAARLWEVSRELTGVSYL